MKKVSVIIMNILSVLCISTGQTPVYDSSTIREEVTDNPGVDNKFSDLFEFWNVGNLHIYSNKNENPNSDYYFKGGKIPTRFSSKLPGDMAVAARKKEGVHAVANISGDDLMNYYLLRFQESKKKNNIVIFVMENDKLVMKKRLAYYQKKGKRAIQVDSWMVDINGDTKLDIIQKKRWIGKNGKVKKEKAMVFLRDEQGNYIRDRKTDIAVEKYIMETL